MPNIRVERAPVGPFFLGYFGFDHLNLAFEPDSLTGVPVPQDEWFVMEGVRSVTLSGPVLAVLGATGNMTLRIANGAVGGDELVAEIGTPETRGSHILNVPVPETTWASMASHALDIQDTQFRYTAYGLSASVNPPLNSTSFIASLMHLAGIDFATNAPRGLRLSPGSETLLGTYDNDIFSLDERINSVFSGYGEDTLQGIHNTSRIDRLYGGGDNDMFLWSRGVDFIHGGDRSLRYADDGIDTIDFSGAGNVHIILVSANSPEHVTPDYVAYHGGHAVWMFSIERLIWNGDGTDNITTGPGLELVEIPLTMDLGGDSGDPRGDELSFEETTDGITVNAGTDTAHFIQSTGAGGPGGWWVESVEWIHGSSGNDRIYTNSELRGIEGGIGDDLIDARLISAFAGTSPEGYDIEIYGGEGSDTIVSGLGITYADGGDGSDTFVLAGLSESSGATIEFIIENADSGDSLVVPYNYFNGSGAGFDGSELMPVLGAIGTMTQLQDGELLYYEHRTWQQATFGNDESDGVIQFIGLIEFELVGNDLLIHFYSGETAVETFVIDDLGNTETYTSVLSSGESHTIVRVVDFQEGDLGLQFLDPGESVDLQIGPDFYAFQPNWDSAVGALNAGFEPALEERPIGPTSDPNALDQSPPTPRTPSTGTPAPDLISYDEPVAVDAGDGDDTIVGSGNSNDVLNGGSGADHMEGAGGDDTYVVDNAGDFVVETVLGGRDDVISLIDYTLPDEVEDLTLAGDARLGVGNELGNRMTGSDGDDQLSGLDGADSLVGGLGDDLLIGGSGNDNYFYHRGEGRDEIIDNGTSATEIDTLYLFGDILPNEVTAYRLQSSPNDLVLAFAGGGTIVITGFYDDPTHGIDRIFFSDGTTWTRQEIDALAASAPLLDNAAPDAHDDPGLIYGGTDYIVPAELLLANDRDHDGDALTIISVSNVSAGTASIDANGDVVLAPPPGFEGQISFTYEVSDGNGGTSTATVEMTIVPNTAPTATATIEDQQASAGTAWSYTLPANLFVDVDFDLVSVTITLADGSPLPEWLSYDWVTQTLSGTPPAGTQQSLDIMVRAFDGFVPTDVTFNLEVAASGNVAPVAADDGGFATLAGVPLVISTPLLLANDSDGNGDSLTIVSVGAAVGGTVSLGLFGTIAFTPSAGFVGLASFEYVVSDGNGGTATATATIDVQAVGTTITGSSADEVLAGTSGNDIFAVLGNNQGFDVYHGGDGLDVVQGSPYNDTFGLANDPTNLAGIEAIAGGSGNDTIRLTSGDDALDLSAIAVSGVELIDAQAGNDTITGSASADIIRGGAGNDVIDGGDGDDTFTIVGGAEGSDVFRGGGGFDTILGSAYNDIIGLANDPTNLAGIEAIAGGSGNDTIRLTSGDDALDLSAIAVSGVELIDAQAGNDTVTGSAGADIIRGGAGNDVIDGGDGDDTFTIVGGAEGSDVFRGGGGFDTILGSAYNDIIGLANDPTNLAGIEAISGGSGNDTIRLTSGDDTLDLSAIAVSGVELIDAQAGNDTVTGSAGADIIRGGAGNDVIDGGDGDDTLTIVGGAEGFDVFRGGGGFDTILGSAYNDIIGLANDPTNLAGIEAISGGSGNDTIRLTSGDDALDLSAIAVSGVELIDAQAGNDTVTGSAGADIIRGGAGADTFVFAAGFGHDIVTDFSVSDGDLIDLTSAAFIDFADLLAHSTQVGADLLISVDAGQSLTLQNMTIAALSSDNVLL